MLFVCRVLLYLFWNCLNLILNFREIWKIIFILCSIPFGINRIPLQSYLKWQSLLSNLKDIKHARLHNREHQISGLNPGIDCWLCCCHSVCPPKMTNRSSRKKWVWKQLCQQFLRIQLGMLNKRYIFYKSQKVKQRLKIAV